MPAIKNEIGNKYGSLLVIDAAENIGQRKAWKCICDCGQEIIVKGTDLRTGRKTHCGCQTKRMGGFKDETGNRYGRLMVLEEAGRGSDRAIRWRCRCDCGNITIVRGRDLRQGKTKSCGCLASEVRGTTLLKDLTGQRFNKLLVLGPKIINTSKGRRTYWECLCDCGNHSIVNGANLRSGTTQSCGCMKSRGNAKIQNILEMHNISFRTEQVFDDLRGIKNRSLRFDFGLYKETKLVAVCEYNGEQHYIDKGTFGKEQREITDEKKKIYCEEHNIPLYIIRYDEDVSNKVFEMLIELDLLEFSDEEEE